MYTRSFREGESAALPPSGYDGIVFDAPKMPENRDTGPTSEENTEESSPVSAEVQDKKNGGGGIIGTLIGNVRGMMKGVSDGTLFGSVLPKIGAEEILILMTAAFLFFSHDGDPECALLLLLLLIVR